MKNTKKSYKNIWAIAIVGLLAIFLFLLITKKQTQVIPIPNNQNSTILSPTMKSNLPKTYHSDFLEITIDIPNDFTLKEQLPEVLLIKNSGVITIHLIGTNRSYKNIQEFLDDSYKPNSLSKEITRKQIKINGIDCEVSIEKYLNQPELSNKAYYCYRNSNSFLGLSTTSSDLYSDLDQIAQSFRYTP